MKITTNIEKNFPQLKQILLLFISNRIILTIIGVFSRMLLERQYGKQYVWSQQLWLDIWGVWDSFWYIDIAEHGYAEIGRNPLSQNQANYAFFPLYPMLMKGLGTVIGDKYFIAGIIISNFCLLIACFVFYQLMHLETDKETALKSVKFLLLSPTGFIFSGVFTESLYIMLAISCFYFAAKKQWLAVGISGFFLALSRSVGVLIIIPLLYEYLKSKEFKLTAIKYEILFLALIPLGLSLFAIYNYQLTGDYFAFAKIQAAWDKTVNNPIVLLLGGIRRGFVEGKMRPLLEASFSITAIGLLLIFFRKIKFSYWIFGIYSIFIPLLTGLESMPRYILPIFPLYIILAKLSADGDCDRVTTMSFGLLQGFLMVFWCCGYSLVV